MAGLGSVARISGNPRWCGRGGEARCGVGGRASGSLAGGAARVLGAPEDSAGFGLRLEEGRGDVGGVLGCWFGVGLAILIVGVVSTPLPDRVGVGFGGCGRCAGAGWGVDGGGILRLVRVFLFERFFALVIAGEIAGGAAVGGCDLWGGEEHPGGEEGGAESGGSEED